MASLTVVNRTTKPRVRGRPRGDRGRFGNRVRVSNDRGQIVVRRRPSAAAAVAAVAQPLPAPVAIAAAAAPVAPVAHVGPVHVNPFLRTTVVAQVRPCDLATNIRPARFISRQIFEIELLFCKFTQFLGLC